MQTSNGKFDGVLCLVVRVETGEKGEKEPQSQEEKKPEEPKTSAMKREKKLKVEEGFQIWSELENQRNKFMVTNCIWDFITTQIKFT